jgi:tyrosinase
MERLQNVGEGKKLSYYQISGIHGQPFTVWDGANGRGGAGYCPHSSNLFGPWHRPYLALIEQRLHFFAVQVANAFPVAQRTAYRNAAATLRLPYWDWASNQVPAIPNSLTSPTITVTRPSGANANIPNPLYAFRFHPLKPADFGNFQPISVYQTTKRWPDGTGPNANSQNNRVEANIRGSAGSYRSRVYNLFAKSQSYNHFSNHGSGSDGDTLESVHDNIHSSFGPNAHMIYLTYSSFDPIFYFHHCNVDRLLAMWQRLYPNTYVEPFRQSGGTFTIAPGSTQDAGSNLTPFHRDAQGTFWTSNSARQVGAFGYTYPEIQDNPSDATLRSRINDLYGPQAAGISPAIAQGAKKRSPVLDTDVAIPLDITPGETLHEYVASVTMPLNPLGATYSLALFLGPFVKDPTTWMTDSNYVGSHSILAMMGMLNTEDLVTGEIVLTQPLLKKFAEGSLTGLDQQTVIQYVHDNMQWAIESNGELIDSSRVPKVSVTLLSTDVKAPTSDSAFPTFLGTTEHGNVTETMA